MHVQSGELEKGKAARLRSLAIQEKVFGADHPVTIANRENAAFLRKAGEIKEAVAVETRMAPLRAKLAAPTH